MILVSLITVSAPAKVAPALTPAKNAAVPKASAPSAHHHASLPASGSPVGEPAPAPGPSVPPKSAAAPAVGSAGLVALAAAFAVVVVRAFYFLMY